MTLKELKAINGDFLTPRQVAAYLHISPDNLRWQARTDPSKLPFPVLVVKTRTRIPKAPFVAFAESLAGKE